MQDQRHATAIAVEGQAVLIEGASGSGKSDLALRLIDQGALLIGDDQVVIKLSESGLVVEPVPTLAGRMEVRGLGIIAVPSTAHGPLGLIVELTDQIERLPQSGDGLPTRSVLGVSVPVMTLSGLEASAPAKIRLALRALSGTLFRPDIDAPH